MPGDCKRVSGKVIHHVIRDLNICRLRVKIYALTAVGRTDDRNSGRVCVIDDVGVGNVINDVAVYRVPVPLELLPPVL